MFFKDGIYTILRGLAVCEVQLTIAICLKVLSMFSSNLHQAHLPFSKLAPKHRTVKTSQRQNRWRQNKWRQNSLVPNGRRQYSSPKSIRPNKIISCLIPMSSFFPLGSNENIFRNTNKFAFAHFTIAPHKMCCL